jgi:hypothetical protein
LVSLKDAHRELYFRFFDEEVVYAWPEAAGVIGKLKEQVHVKVQAQVLAAGEASAASTKALRGLSIYGRLGLDPTTSQHDVDTMTP